MKSKILVGLGALGLSMSVVGAGCGDDTSGSGASGDTTTSTTNTTGGNTVTSNTVTVAASTSSGMMGDGNDTIGMATPMDETNGVPNVSENDVELNPPDSDVDFYSFNGLAGPALIVGLSKPQGEPFAATDPDLVISLFDSNQMLIATNDDPYPRDGQDSALLTILPSDGTYYLKVEEFCQTPMAGCDAAYFDGLTDLSYGVEVYMEAAGALANPVGEVEPTNNMAAGATPANPLETMPGSGQYFATIGYGEFAASDVDYFSVTMPDNLPIANGGRPGMSLVFQPPGKTIGSGSSQFTGLVRVEDTLGNIIALQDWSTEANAVDFAEINVPLTGGTDYLIRVVGGPNDPDGDLAPFFIYTNGFSEGNPVELQDVTNNLQATPEVLSTVGMDPDSYFLDGNLGPLDEDNFQVAVAGPMFAFVCLAQRYGSGIRGLTVDIIAASDGSVLASGVEAADAQLFQQDIDPAGETNLIIKLTKSSQDTLVLGDYYRCGFNFYTP